MSVWRELSPEKSDGLGIIKNVVCAYCRNRFKYRGITSCSSEGLYRNLEPMELGDWQRPPKLPAMSKLMDYAPVTRMTLMYLVLHYLAALQDEAAK